MIDVKSVLTVRTSITVDESCARAFEVFTRGFDTWWPRDHRIGQVELDAAVIEPWAGGRWFERGVDGTECDWGKVVTYEPPSRLVLAWHLNGRWQFDPDPDHASEVEVRFVAEGPARTRVECEHRGIERAIASDALRAGVSSPSGWPGLLQLFATTAHDTVR